MVSKGFSFFLGGRENNGELEMGFVVDKGGKVTLLSSKLLFLLFFIFIFIIIFVSSFGKKIDYFY